MNKSIFFLLALLIIAFNTEAADRIDSLLKASNSKNDSLRAEALLNLSYEFEFNKPYLSFIYAMDAIKIAKANKYYEIESSAYEIIGVINSEKEDLVKAEKYFMLSLKTALKTSNTALIGSGYGNLGNICYNKNDYEKAISYYQLACKTYEKGGNSIGIGLVYGTMGNMYYNNKKYNDALKYYNLSTEYFKKSGRPEDIATNDLNIGLVYKSLNQFDKALENINTALKVFTQENNTFNKAQCIASIGSCYSGKGDYNMALKYLFEALDEFLLTQQETNISIVYSDIATCYQKQGKYQEALKYYHLQANLKNSFVNEIATKTLKEMYNIYGELGDYKNAFIYQGMYLNQRDSLDYLDRKKNLDKLLTEFEAERKDNEIKIKDLQLQKAHSESNTQRLYIFTLLLGIILIVALLVLIFNRYRIKQKANARLVQKNQEINKQNVEITAQRDEIFRQKKDITDSIHYAKRIQTALLPDSRKVSEILHGGFCLFMPRDIVSGDFYWMNKIGTKRVIIAGDSTGHGVPGAFMSIIGMNFLNEIINERNVLYPGEILELLRTLVVQALQQSGTTAETKDGMDISVCTIDDSTKKIQFAGAYNPLYIIRKKQYLESNDAKLQNDNYALVEIKADRIPIGVSDKMEHRYSTREIEVFEGDMFYLFSDGYYDQFGGDKNEKLKLNRFKNTILSLSGIQLENQHQYIEQQFVNWRGTLEQVDDVLILGFK